MFSKFIYYLLQYTWGLPLTIVGWIVAAALRITGHKPVLWYGPCPVFVIGKRWGGVSIGTTIIVDDSTENFPESKGGISQILNHEFGHSIQNALFGPFMLFLVSVPSAIRYQWSTRKMRKDPEWGRTFDYYGIWFEFTASVWGETNYIYVWKPHVEE